VVAVLRCAVVVALIFLGTGAVATQNVPKPSAPKKTLDIYWIDVEGGAATLLVSPEGESLLYDAGWEVDNRDAHRIAEVVKMAGLSRIDAFVLSHYHADHVGGLAGLAALIPIGRYFDHGDEVVEADRARYEIYRSVAGHDRKILKAGDTITMRGDVEAKVVASNGQFIRGGINKGGNKNPACNGAERKPVAPPENFRNVGTLFTYGNFTFLDLADLDWASEMRLACPKNLLGTVSIWQTSRHGALDGAGSPALLSGIRPQVIVANNGPRKGLGLSTPPSYSYEKIAKLPGVESIWQGHRALADPEHNAPDNYIANFEETADCKGHWIKASASEDGSFTITNGRNGFSRTYKSRNAR
jgi:beta-lactamase superfamily II metal-dependent hydrolase